MPPTSALIRARSFGLCSNRQVSCEITGKRLLKLELSSERELRSYFNGGVNSLDVEAHDGRYLLAGGGDASVALYDLQHSSNLQNNTWMHDVVQSTAGKSGPMAHKFSVETVTWFPHDTGMFITSGMDHTIKIWDTNTWTVAEEFEFDTPVYTHAVSPSTSHSLIAIGRKEHNIKLYNMETGSTSHILRGHTDAVLSLAWSPRNDYHLVSGSADRRILMWDIRRAKSMLCALDQHNGRQQRTFEGKLAHNGYVIGLKYAPDGLRIASLASDSSLRLWDATTAENTLVNFGPVYLKYRKSLQMAISYDCRQPLVFVPASNNIECYELATGRYVKSLKGHYMRSSTCVLRPRCQELFSGGEDKRILWWSTPRGPCLPMDTYSTSTSNGHAKAVDIPKALQDEWSSDEGD